VDWVRRFLDHAAKQQGAPQPRVAPEVVRDYLAHLAVHQHVSVTRSWHGWVANQLGFAPFSNYPITNSPITQLPATAT
jgi:hypothetical protein